MTSLCLSETQSSTEAADADKGSVVLNVALYPYTPDNTRFEASIRAEWAKIHPEVELHFLPWDCYYEDVPEAMDVFAFDVQYLSYFAEKGFLMPIPQEALKDKADLLPFALDGCMVDGVLYAVPQMVCTSLLYTRKDDSSLSSVRDVISLHEVMGDRIKQSVVPEIGEGLLVDMSINIIMIFMYLEALCDITGVFIARDEVPDPNIVPSDQAIASVRMLRAMGGASQVEMFPGNDIYVRARWFSEGRGRAYIGFTEAMSAMSDKEYIFRPFSFAKNEGFPTLSVDGVGIHLNIDPKKKALALDLVNIMTGRTVMVKSISPDIDHPSPQYLMSARISVYDDLGVDFPQYVVLKDVVTNPNNRANRLGKNARKFIEDMQKIVDMICS